MTPETLTYTAPRWRLTQWLIKPPDGTPDDIRAELVRGLFGSLPVFVTALCNTALVAAIAAGIAGTPVFYGWLAVEITICLVRVAVLVYSHRAARQGRPTPTDLHVLLSVVWSMSIGAGAFIGLTSGDLVLATLTCMSASAMSGGICFRNFGAPRLTITMLACAMLPICPGTVLSGHLALLAIFVQLPMLFVGMGTAAFKLNRMLVSTMAAERESGYRARHDDLTGLDNRASLMSQLGERLGRSGRAGSAFAVLYLDLDGFKAVNDTFGHATGDRVLQLVADRLNGLVRIGDVTARLGGDEFVVLADDMDECAAAEFAERLVGGIARTYDVGGHACVIGVSIGVACAPRHGTDVNVLLAAADAALYHAKALGRSRVAVAGPKPRAVSAGEAPLAPAGDEAALAASLTMRA